MKSRKKYETPKIQEIQEKADNDISGRGRNPTKDPCAANPTSKGNFLGGKRLPTTFHGFPRLFIGTGKRGHYERGLFAWRVSRISKISRFSRISRKWPDSPLFSTVWGFSRISRISKISRISRKWTFWKDPFSKRPLFPNPISAWPCLQSLVVKLCLKLCVETAGAKLWKAPVKKN